MEESNRILTANNAMHTSSAITTRLQIESHRRGVGDGDRWAVTSSTPIYAANRY